MAVQPPGAIRVVQKTSGIQPTNSSNNHTNYFTGSSISSLGNTIKSFFSTLLNWILSCLGFKKEASAKPIKTPDLSAKSSAPAPDEQTRSEAKIYAEPKSPRSKEHPFKTLFEKVTNAKNDDEKRAFLKETSDYIRSGGDIDNELALSAIMDDYYLDDWTQILKDILERRPSKEFLNKLLQITLHRFELIVNPRKYANAMKEIIAAGADGDAVKDDKKMSANERLEKWEHRDSKKNIALLRAMLGKPAKAKEGEPAPKGQFQALVKKATDVRLSDEEGAKLLKEISDYIRLEGDIDNDGSLSDIIDHYYMPDWMPLLKVILDRKPSQEILNKLLRYAFHKFTDHAERDKYAAACREIIAAGADKDLFKHSDAKSIEQCLYESEHYDPEAPENKKAMDEILEKLTAESTIKLKPLPKKL